MRISLWLFISIFFWQAVSSTMTPQADHREIRQHIAKLMKLDPAGRLIYIQKQGVDIYVVPISQSAQNNFQNLSWAPKKFAQLEQDFADGSTAGLYLTPANDSYKVSRPTILIAQDAEPWSLIHEFVHALLDKERSAQKETNNETSLVRKLEDAREDLNEVWWSYQANKSISPEQKIHLFTSFLIVAELDSQLLKVIQLEEILVEGLLRQAYKIYQPSDFKVETYEYSAVYIKKSAEKAQSQIRALVEKCPALIELAIEDKSFIQRRLVQACRAVRELQNEIRELESAAL